MPFPFLLNPKTGCHDGREDKEKDHHQKGIPETDRNSGGYHCGNGKEGKQQENSFIPHFNIPLFANWAGSLPNPIVMGGPLNFQLLKFWGNGKRDAGGLPETGSRRFP
jgi:hypothetical protein